MPVVVRQARMVQTLLNSVEVLQLQFLRGYVHPCDPAATLGRDSQVPQTQFIAGVCGHCPFTLETGTHSCSCAWRALFGRHGGGDEGGLLRFCIFSASGHLDVEAQGGGDAGSLTPN